MNPVRSPWAEKILRNFFLLSDNGGITKNKRLSEIDCQSYKDRLLTG